MTPALRLSIQDVCKRIPPLWPLQNFVAVNPFLGLSHLPFCEAHKLLERVGHAGILMDASYYLDRIQNGAIGDEDIRFALPLGERSRDSASWLCEQLAQQEASQRILTVADWLDGTPNNRWADFVTDEISKWCSSYFDRGQGSWEMPWSDLPLFEAWKQAAANDWNPEVVGLPGFRQFVRNLPDSVEASLAWCLSRLDVPPPILTDFLHRELMSVFGWSAYAAYYDRSGLNQPILPQLLAIRLAYDAALLALADGWKCHGEGRPPNGLGEAKHIAQLALENAFRSRLLAKLKQSSKPANHLRSQLQAVFCIDVRSEVYRRALEAQSPDIETVGFAGFFGMPIEVSHSARCPVLVGPKYAVSAVRAESNWSRVSQWAGIAWKSVRNSAAGSFASVEVAGGWSGVKILRQFMGPSKPEEPTFSLSWQIPVGEEVELAAQALKNMSLEAARLAPVVLICGHGSKTENNPYGSSLDCGACGGHKGDINARFAAALLNKPEVRAGLKERGVLIPSDTRFIAGLHVTTTDDVILYDADDLSQETARWLKSASRQAMLDRSRTLLSSTLSTPAKLDEEIRRRSVDWSEVRPEWGLAGNAAFIAAPRWRTRGIDLEGRVFLHDYDPASDLDGSVLTLILTAPVVVASWINLQYYGSTVNNRLYGSGNKVLHNVVGTFGVWEGNAGDLRTGLPLQSLHDGRRWIHEPLRLQVLIDAPRHRIDSVLAANPEIHHLIENNWIQLLAIGEHLTQEG